MGADDRHGSVRRTWRPGRRLRFVLVAVSVGSLLGLLFGLTALNRPVANAAAFYVLGAGVAALAAGVVVVLWTLARRPRAHRAPVDSRRR